MNPAYKKNLLQIKNLVLVKFLKDTMVDPKESEVSVNTKLWGKVGKYSVELDQTASHFQ